MKKLNKLLIVLLFGIACNTPEVRNNDQEQSDKANSVVDTIEVEEHKTEPKELIAVPNQYKVVSLDYDNKDWLQRIFVESQTEIIENTRELKEIICDLDSMYTFDEGTSVSFFSDAKYAKYLDKLLEGLDSSQLHLFANNWKNEIYIGEFECDSNKLTLYPVSTTHSQAMLEIEDCN